jgi:2-polyprenyl-3-methyl-5-hydroxy-6-metoxy-1,4-benzoquinol methylase
VATVQARTVDEAKLEAFVEQATVDMSAAISGLLMHIGDRLGLYKAMADAGPITSSVLAARTGTTERYVREWLSNQAAGGYVVYNPMEGTFELPPEQAMVVADEDSPVFLGGIYETIASCYADHAIVVDAFRCGTGDRLGRSTTRACSPASCGCTVPATSPTLVHEWLPALDGVVEKLRAGASVADIGCGLGASTIVMAAAFTRSTFAGIDIHEPSIIAAREAAMKGRREPSGEVRDGDRQAAARHRLRPGVPVRLPARDG